MGNVGGGEILVILLAALIFLGPEKLPDVARQIGKVLGEVRRMSSGFQREVHDAMRMVDDAMHAPDTTRPTPVLASPEGTEGSQSAAPEGAGADATAPVTDRAVAIDAPGVAEAGPVTVAEPSGPASAEPPLPADVAHGGDR